MASSLPLIDQARSPGFDKALRDCGHGPLRRRAVTTVQINVGKLCNQACHHCHVDAGPKRTEIMTAETAERIAALVEATASVRTVDITGGAPELCPSFRSLVRRFCARDLEVIDRCNLTILVEPGQEDLAGFLAEHRVRVVASLPCYTQDNVDKQRGRGVFDKSIEGLLRLNALGYGVEGSGLVLDLVYNPGGPFLPPPQETLQADYQQRLFDDFGIRFDSLLTITNMPIARFADDLERQGRLEEYVRLLADSFNPATVDQVMCRDLVSIGWDGQLYDCDFNQMLEIGLGQGTRTIWNLDSFDDLERAEIAVDRHCFGCTAGAGSSCGGALG